MTIADHLRAVLAIQNPKHFRTAEEQEVLIAAERALSEHSSFREFSLGRKTYARADGTPPADQRASFIEAMGRDGGDEDHEPDEDDPPHYGPMTEFQDGMTRVMQNLYPEPIAEKRELFLAAMERKK